MEKKADFVTPLFWFFPGEQYEEGGEIIIIMGAEYCGWNVHIYVQYTCNTDTMNAFIGCVDLHTYPGVKRKK